MTFRDSLGSWYMIHALCVFFQMGILPIGLDPYMICNTNCHGWGFMVIKGMMFTPLPQSIRHLEYPDHLYIKSFHIQSVLALTKQTLGICSPDFFMRMTNFIHGWHGLQLWNLWSWKQLWSGWLDIGFYIPACVNNGLGFGVTILWAGPPLPFVVWKLPSFKWWCWLGQDCSYHVLIVVISMFWGVTLLWNLSK